MVKEHHDHGTHEPKLKVYFQQNSGAKGNDSWNSIILKYNSIISTQIYDTMDAFTVRLRGIFLPRKNLRTMLAELSEKEDDLARSPNKQAPDYRPQKVGQLFAFLLKFECQFVYQPTNFQRNCFIKTLSRLACDELRFVSNNKILNR